MTGTSKNERPFTSDSVDYDFNLGIRGFKYSDLYDAVKLREIAEKFYGEVKEKNPVLSEALTKYIAARGSGYEARVESKILTDGAPYLSDFVARMFGIGGERDELQNEILKQNPVWAYKFFVQRRAIKKFTAETIVDFNEAELTLALTELKNTAFSQTLVHDEELAVAEIAVQLLEAEEILTKNLEMTERAQKTLGKISAAYDALKDKTFGAVFSRYILESEETGELLQVKAVLHLLEAWSAIQFFGKKKRWHSLKTPHGLDYQNLVHLIHPREDVPELLRGANEELRQRDGFKLTDDRGTMRDSLYEVDYCLICHEREKDSCSTGLHEKDGSPKRNSLGIKLEGCPLDEKISEMHLLKRQGDSIASLALVTIDNPMCAGTGHRICNDCMKGCIFQKQDPVNIPLAETATLTDVLNLPYGFEIYSLLTRWNPLNARRPYALPYNGKNVLVVGLGPAGYTLAHYLLNEGFGVIGVDGLKIEPLP
ncbi:MAG TPA: hypothetical protein VK308_15875, partial [Pyrinomonadaceae bacterium]|nr:hypothetical protein [Pyrinomonadaceae bacterium]